MVDCPQPIAGNQDDLAGQLCDQIPYRKALAQGHQQTAYPLDEQALAAASNAPDSPQDVLQADEAMVFSGGNQRRNRFSKKERGDLVGGQLAVLNCAQEFCVCAAAGTERFHGQRVAAGLPQVMEEQSGQQGLANAGVGTGNEDNAW